MCLQVKITTLSISIARGRHMLQISNLFLSFISIRIGATEILLSFFQTWTDYNNVNVEVRGGDEDEKQYQKRFSRTMKNQLKLFLRMFRLDRLENIRIVVILPKYNFNT